MYMENYVQTTLKEMPIHIILLVGTNDVPTKKDSDQIAESTVNLKIKPKKNCEVSISGITARHNQHQKKEPDVNWKLKEKGHEKKFTVHEPWWHYNGKTLKRFNDPKLHINKKRGFI